MSLVKYTNKKTGVVALYESTSHYDPKTKQSRPTRKYLGLIDPKTGELIPTSGQVGRKGKNGEENKAESAKIKKLEAVISKKNDEINSLESEINSLKARVRLYEKAIASVSEIFKKLHPET